MNKTPSIIDKVNIDFVKKYKCTGIIRYDTESSRSFVTKIDKETYEESFDHWLPVDFRQLIKEKYGIDVE